MTQDALTLMSFGAALLVYSPWLLLLLAVTVLPSFLGETHFATLEYSLLFRYTPERRRLDYLRYIGASDETAKEVQMFGLAPWLIQRFKLFSRRFYEENKRLSIRRSLVSTGLSIIGTAGYYSAYIIIVVRAVKGSSVWARSRFWREPSPAAAISFSACFWVPAASISNVSI